MLCPNCLGRGYVPLRKPLFDYWTMAGGGLVAVRREHEECSYPGCHNGFISCSDPDNVPQGANADLQG